MQVNHCINKLLLVCAWEDQRENWFYILHKISSTMYGKYSTVVSKYSTVILILVNECSKQPPLITVTRLCLYRGPMYWLMLNQQWEQLAIYDFLCWHFMDPNQDQSWLQLVLPKQICPLILGELQQGDRQWAPRTRKTLGHLKEQFHWLGHFSNIHKWCESCIRCATSKIPAYGWRASPGTIAVAGHSCWLSEPLPESDNRNKWLYISSNWLLRPLGGNIPSAQSKGQHSSNNIVWKIVVRDN